MNVPQVVAKELWIRVAGQLLYGRGWREKEIAERRGDCIQAVEGQLVRLETFIWGRRYVPSPSTQQNRAHMRRQHMEGTGVWKPAIAMMNQEGKVTLGSKVLLCWQARAVVYTRLAGMQKGYSLQGLHNREWVLTGSIGEDGRQAVRARLM